eukprot:1259711-Pyramimonas_sp.AAC.1
MEPTAVYHLANPGFQCRAGSHPRGSQGSPARSARSMAGAFQRQLGPPKPAGPPRVSALWFGACPHGRSR